MKWLNEKVFCFAGVACIVAGGIGVSLVAKDEANKQVFTINTAFLSLAAALSLGCLVCAVLAAVYGRFPEGSASKSEEANNASQARKTSLYEKPANQP